MYNLNKLELVNYMLWDEVEFNFEEGVTLISGGNRSGKSLLFSCLKPMLYDSLELPKNARATLSFDNQHHDYDFTVYNQGKKTNRFEVTIDGKQQKSERIADARRIINTHFVNNIQESIFETTISLTGLGKHPLTTGKPSTRLDWVHETLAYASILDSYVYDVDKQIKDTKEGSVKYTLLRQQLNDLTKLEKPVIKVSELKHKFKQISNDIREKESIKRDVEHALKNKNLSSEIQEPKVSYKEAQKQLEKADNLLISLAEQKKQYEINKDKLKTIAKLEEKLEESKQNYKKACKKYNVPAINPVDVEKNYENNLTTLKSKLKEAEKTNEVYEEQSDIRKFLKKYKDISSPTNDEDIKQLNRQIKTLNKELTINKLIVSSHEKGDEYCSVCGSDLQKHDDIDTIYQKIKKAEKKINGYEVALKLYKYRKINLANHVDTSKLEKELHYTEIIGKLAIKYIEVKSSLNEYKKDHSKVKPFDNDKYIKASKDYKLKQKQWLDCQVYKTTKSQLSEIKENKYFSKSTKKLSKLSDSLDDELSKLYKEQRLVNESIIQTETNTVLYRKYIEEKRTLIDNIKQYKTFSRDYKILTVLKKALGRDGFRTKRLESTLELFVDNLNDLAPLIWKEPFKFEIETGPRKCDLIIHRNRKVGNAFTLSGSEQRCLQLLSSLAMLRLLPNNRRCNTIILDELEANLDESAVHMMMNDFIPELQKTVKNIILVSPLSNKQLGLKPDRQYLVKKKSAKSKLIRL